MPFAPHLRVTALGALGSGGLERFSYGLNLASFSNALIPMDPNQTVFADIAEDIRAFHGDGAARISHRAILQEVKIASIGADGKYTANPVIVNVADTPGGIPATNAGAAYTLPQAAVACSLLTNRRGPRGKGRMYLPMPVVTIEAGELVMPSAERDTISNAFRNLVLNLGNQPGADALDLRVVVASSYGHNEPVTGIRVGRVVDTIRSRRRSLPEQYNVSQPTAQS